VPNLQGDQIGCRGAVKPPKLTASSFIRNFQEMAARLPLDWQEVHLTHQRGKLAARGMMLVGADLDESPMAYCRLPASWRMMPDP
jgi:hypothetical protein